MADPHSERDALEVLASQFMERLRQGEDPDIAEYAAANPELAEDILDIFPTIAEAERIKLSRRRAQTTQDRVHRPGSLAGLEAAAMQDGTADPHESMQLGKYSLLCPLGQGSLGTVWLSQHPELGIRVAVKVLRRGILRSSEVAVRRFLGEAHAAALINHPHIVRVFDAGSDQGLHYLVMEYVDGGSVGDLMKQAGGRLAIARAIEIAMAIAEALEAVAEAGIVHRDIKPDNILLDRGGAPKLADLGLAKHLGDSHEGATTTTGTGVGTPLYIAPEQATDGAAVDARADIYSLGATLYHMVTGQPPFSGSTAFQIMQNHLQQPLVSPEELNPELSLGEAQVIVKMLAKSPADRYQTAAEARADLARANDGLPPTARPIRRLGPVLRRAAAAVVVVLAVAAGLTAGITYWRQRPAPRSQGLPPLPAGSRRPFPPGGGMGGEGGEGFPRRPGGNGLAPRLGTRGTTDGSLRPEDWQMLTGEAGRDARPRPLAEGQYTLDGGVLRIVLGRAVRGPASLLYGAAALREPFVITMEARNLTACGILSPRDQAGGCRILLRDPESRAATDGRWQRIEIRSRPGGIICTVDGQPAHAVRGRPSGSGRFSIQIPPHGNCELRSFSLQNSPGGSRPPPARPPER